MTDFDDLKRPTLAFRRASGPSTSSDRETSFSAGLAMPDRLHRVPSPAEHTPSSSLGHSSRGQQRPSYGMIQHLPKLNHRSASTNVPTSTPSSRPLSFQSVGGEADVGGNTTNTASPLDTPVDVIYDVDPLLAATKRSLSASPSIFDQGNSSSMNSGSGGIPASAAAVAHSKGAHQKGVMDRGNTAGGASTATTTMKTKGEGVAWQEPKAPLPWTTGNPSVGTTVSNSTPISPSTAIDSPSLALATSNDQQQKLSEESKSDKDLVSLTESLSMNEESQGGTASRSSTVLGEESIGQQQPPQQQQEQQHHLHPHPLPPPNFNQQQPPQATTIPSSQLPLSQHHPYHQQAQYYHSMEARSPDVYPLPYQRSPMTAMNAMDPTNFEAFRATPDPYAPMYGLPPPSVASSSTPQSPTFGHHGHQSSTDSSMFMYPQGAYPVNTMAGLPGLPGGGMMAHRAPVVGLGGPGGHRPPLAAASAASNSAMLMQGMPPYPSQSPMMMSSGPSGMDRTNKRDGPHSISTFQGPVPIPVNPFGIGSNQWGTTPAQGPGFLHGHSPSWSGSMDTRTSGAGHQRMLSGAQAYPTNPMALLPSTSMSPPPSFYRPPGPGRVAMHSRSPSSFSQFSQHRSSQSDTQRSPLLEEFRSRHNKGRRFELSDIRGALVEFSSDQHGSRFTQEKLDTASEEELKYVFEELLPSAPSLMTDVFGNYVIQKLVEHGTEEMRLQLVDQMQGHILSLSLGTYGCRVVQKALEYVKVSEQMRMAEELRRDILACVRDQNANHVVQKILEQVSPTTLIDFIPQAFRNNVYSLAAHCYSCRVLQRIFEHCEESQRRPLIDELLKETERLMHDQYGNYVIQWILQNASKQDKDVVIKTAKGNVLRLSRHKFASNVVEQVIRAASQEERYSLIEEIMTTVRDEANGEPTVGAIVMMKDQYGNYVLQRFLELSEGQQKIRLISLVKPALNNIKRFSSGYAKHLSAIERLLDSNIVRNNAGTMTTMAVVPGDGGVALSLGVPSSAVPTSTA